MPESCRVIAFFYRSGDSLLIDNEGAGTMAKTITPRDLATEFHTDETVVRKFLRDITPEAAQPGMGRRWSIPGTKAELRKLRNQFDLWSVRHETLVKHHSAAS